MEIKTLLEQRGLLIFDGAMGTQLQAKGLRTGETPELLNLTAKDLLKEIHRSYIDAGADIISANTFGANSYKLSHSGKSVDEIITAGIINCKEAIKESGKDAGVAINPGTSVSFIESVLPIVDSVLVMTVNPGWGGQRFIPQMIDKIQELDSRRSDGCFSYIIGADGGVGRKNIRELYQNGLELAVMGTAFFNEDDKSSFLHELEEMVE